MHVFSQIIKFLIVGVSNTFVDLAVLNLLMFASGVASGIAFTMFKAISFGVAVANSYFWNRRWTFRSESKVFAQFALVSVVGLFLNVGAASFVVNVMGPRLGLPEHVWANIGAITGTIIVMTWNFLGYKFVVFKK